MKTRKHIEDLSEGLRASESASSVTYPFGRGCFLYFLQGGGLIPPSFFKEYKSKPLMHLVNDKPRSEALTISLNKY